MKQVVVIEDYEVATRIVRLGVIIGDAQIGASIVKLESAEIAKGEIDNVPVGKGPAIEGKRLFIKTVVTDVNDATNSTSVTYRLTGGTGDWDYTVTENVDQNGDSIVYRAKFTFV